MGDDDADKFPPLQPLRIPAGWKIAFNHLFEPNKTDKFQDFQTEDVFAAEQGEFVVALSWYPCGDPSGHYVVELVRVPPPEIWEQLTDDPWRNPLCRLEIKNRKDSIAELECILGNGPL